MLVLSRMQVHFPALSANRGIKAAETRDLPHRPLISQLLPSSPWKPTSHPFPLWI